MSGQSHAGHHLQSDAESLGPGPDGPRALGALLIALPATGLGSMATVVRDLSLRVTLAAAGAALVVARGAAALLGALA